MCIRDREPQNKLPISRFNLSNDKFYESHYTGRLVRVRQTLGELVVQHALPALKLHPVLVSENRWCIVGMTKRLTFIVYIVQDQTFKARTSFIPSTIVSSASQF